jgi:hypothetical protein
MCCGIPFLHRRARVKRRRAQLAKEAKKTKPEAHTDGNQQPDLIELSRDLPSGWQVHLIIVFICCNINWYTCILY